MSLDRRPVATSRQANSDPSQSAPSRAQYQVIAGISQSRRPGLMTPLDPSPFRVRDGVHQLVVEGGVRPPPVPLIAHLGQELGIEHPNPGHVEQMPGATVVAPGRSGREVGPQMVGQGRVPALDDLLAPLLGRRLVIGLDLFPPDHHVKKCVRVNAVIMRHTGWRDQTRYVRRNDPGMASRRLWHPSNQA